MTGINLGNDFNTELVALAGWNPDTIDATTLTVDLVNTGGPTTVRANISANVDTTALQTLITKYTTPTTDTTT